MHHSFSHKLTCHLSKHITNHTYVDQLITQKQNTAINIGQLLADDTKILYSSQRKKRLKIQEDIIIQNKQCI